MKIWSLIKEKYEYKEEHHSIASSLYIEWMEKGYIHATCKKMLELDDEMGCQDLSYGLFRSNVSDTNLTWVGNEYFNKVYHYIEDVYTKVKSSLVNGEILDRYICSDYCWFVVRDKNKVIVPVFSFESADYIEHIRIGLANLNLKAREIKVHDFYKCELFDVHQNYDEINIYNFEQKQCLLYEIKVEG